MDNKEFTEDKKTDAKVEPKKADLPNEEFFKKYLDEKLKPILEGHETFKKELKESVQNTVDELVTSYQRDMAKLQPKKETPQEKSEREYLEQFHSGTYFKKI